MLQNCKDCGKEFEAKRNKKYCDICGSDAAKCARYRKKMGVDPIKRTVIHKNLLKKAYAWKKAGIIGATPAKYLELKEEQGGVCAICGNHPNKRELALDHNHETGEIRGLLCYRCNYGLAWFEWFNKNPERLQCTVDYLRVSVPDAGKNDTR
jgi:hypothetical protein